MTSTKTWICNGIRFVVTAGLLLPSATWAQAAKAKAAPKVEAEIEEITVTAQKREESLQEIPISVTALGSATLDEKGVRDMIDLGAAVPNLRITGGNTGPSSNTITLRGLNGSDPNISLQSPVGTYVDGVYIAKIVGNNFDLDDLERVEVLRGPQGTLYGRNTMGGAVNFITKKPTEERSITLRSEAGNYDTFNTRVTANVPLVGKNGFWQSDAIGMLSLRETVGYKSHDGYFRNALRAGEPASPTPSGGSKLTDLNRVYTTTALRWQPNEDVTVDYSFEYHRYRDAAPAWQLTYIYPQSLADKNYRFTFPNGSSIVIPNPVFPAGLTPYVQKNRVDSTPLNALYEDASKSLHRLADDGNERMHILTGAWHLGQVGPVGDVTLKSIASYRSFTINWNGDLDGTPNHMADVSNRYDVQHWSEELQWLGTAPRLHYVAGFYYYAEYGTYDNPFVGVNGSVNNTYKNISKNKSYAPYGQITWTPPILSDKLSLTAGLRYTQEQPHVEKYYRDRINPRNDWSGAHGKAFGGSDALAPLGDISYQWTDEVMTYFRIARGFKGGGFAGQAGSPQAFAKPFDPEQLLQYEAGFKTQWLDNRLRLNASGFYSDYSDKQVSVFRPTEAGLASVVENAASAEIWGMEFEGTVVPIPGLEATVTYAFLAPKYTEWIDQKFDSANKPVYDPVTGQPVLEDVSDQRAFAFSAKNQFTLGVTYTVPPTEFGTLSTHIDTYWQDRVEYQANADTLGGQAIQGWDYWLVNGRVQFAGIPLQKGSLDLAVFGRNLFDRKYRIHGIDFGSQFGFAGNVYGDPRTFGLQLTYNFTAS